MYKLIKSVGSISYNKMNEGRCICALVQGTRGHEGPTDLLSVTVTNANIHHPHPRVPEQVMGSFLKMETKAHQWVHF